MKLSTASLLFLLATPATFCAPLPGVPNRSVSVVNVGDGPFIVLPTPSGHISLGPGPQIPDGLTRRASAQDIGAPQKPPFTDKTSDGARLARRGWAWFEWFGELISLFHNMNKRDLDTARRNVFNDFFEDVGVMFGNLFVDSKDA